MLCSCFATHMPQASSPGSYGVCQQVLICPLWCTFTQSCNTKQAQSQWRGAHTCEQPFTFRESQSALHILPVLVDHEVAVFSVNLQAQEQRVEPTGLPNKAGLVDATGPFGPTVRQTCMHACMHAERETLPQ